MQLLLTEKQLRVLRFYRDFWHDNGLAPTLEEAASALGVSKITIHEHIKHLETKGAIRRDRAKARSVAILYDPDGQDGQPDTQRPELPILGTIAAGRPIEAIEDREVVELQDLVPTGDDYYLLRVSGKSMIEDHIDDGDLVVIERRQTADEGDVVVAIVDDGEATLKRFHRDGGRIRLQPANSTLSPIYPNKLEIRGVLRGVIRQL